MATTRRAAGPATPATPPAPPVVPVVPANPDHKNMPLLLGIATVIILVLLGYYLIPSGSKKRNNNHTTGKGTAIAVSSNNKWDYYQLQKAGDKYSIDVPPGHHMHTFADTLHLFQRYGEPMDTVGGQRNGNPYNKEEKGAEISFFQVPVKVTVLIAENGNCQYKH